jgi:oligopeptide transport system permease protein
MRWLFSYDLGAFGLAEAGFLLLLGLGIAMVVRPALGARLLKRPLRVWHVFAPALLGFSILVHPFGFGWLGALSIVVLLGTTHAVLAQGPQMRRYVLRRLIGAPIVIALLLALSFVIMRTAPGGPFDKEKAVDPEIRARLNEKYGYNLPLYKQFGKYMGDLLWEGDLGPSTKQKGWSVNDIIKAHAGPSARLGLAATALALLIGLTSGLIAGMRRNSIFDYASMTGAMIGLAVPTFVVGPLLVLAFAMKLDWFHVSGWDVFPRDLVLPAITLSLPFAARVARLTRAGMLEVVHQDYVRTARAKGLSEPAIIVRHTLKGALLPVVTFLGPAIAQLLTGSLVVEMIFNVPGLGVEFVQSALNRDYSLAMGLVVFFGTLLILFNLVVDVAYGFLDPRIRHA